MSLHLQVDTTADEDRLQLLLAKQAQLEQLQAEISSLRSFPPSTSPLSSTYHGRIQKHHHQHAQHRRNNMSRSSSSSGVAPMARQSSSDRIELPQSRARTFSQRSAPSMARGNSKGSTSQRNGNLPFTQNGAMPPPLHSEPRRENPAIMAWKQQEQPLSPYNLSHQPFQSQRPISQRVSGLEQVRELEDLTDPGDFLRNLGTTFTVSPLVSIPSPSTMSIHRLSSSFNMSPSTPTSDMLTSATTFTDSMSRQDSLCNEPFIEKIQMMKFGSSSSYSPDVNLDQTQFDQASQFSYLQSRRSSNEEQSNLLVGAGGASHESQFSHSFPLQSPGPFGAKMEKSRSIESNSSSSSSSSSRNVKRLQDQIRVANARPLVSKGGSIANAMSRENSSQLMTRLESRDGLQESKIPICTKSSYQRPKHDRVYCDQCENHAEGFRGPHELSRHKDREHKMMVKKWVCIEPAEGQPQVKPVVPLSRCKACSQQKKKYGAYYNAAAHLRRAHFKPRAKGRGKNSKTEDAEKRGGKGGGDWPLMSDLKHWMKEVEEPANEYTDDTQSTVADAAEDDLVEELDEENTYSQHSIPSMARNDFGNSYVDDNSMLDTNPLTISTYPTAINNNNNLFGMGNITLDLSGASQQSLCGLDQPMFNTSSAQNNFSSFSPDIYQNEQQMFYESSPFLITQNVEDQILTGPDFVNHYF